MNWTSIFEDRFGITHSELKLALKELGGRIRLVDARKALAMVAMTWGDAEKLKNLLDQHGYDILTFVKTAEPICNYFHLSLKHAHEEVEIAATLYLDLAVKERLSIQQILDDKAHQISESKWVGLPALRKAVDREIEVRDGVPFSAGEGEALGEFMWKVFLFHPDVAEWELIAQSAERMLNDSYTVGSDRADLAKFGFDLDKLEEGGVKCLDKTRGG